MTHYRNGIVVAIVALVIAVGTPAFSAKPVPPPKVEAGSLGVYDGAGLFLGYLADSPGYGQSLFYRVYNPSIPATLSVMLAYPPHFDATKISDIYFASTDCSGQPYSTTVNSSMSELLWLNYVTPNTFYILDSEATNDLFLPRSDLKSNFNLTLNACEPVSLSSDQIVAYPIKEVQVPLFNTPLTYPIVIKPIQ